MVLAGLIPDGVSSGLMDDVEARAGCLLRQLILLKSIAETPHTSCSFLLWCMLELTNWSRLHLISMVFYS